MRLKQFAVFLLLGCLFVPRAHATTKLEVSGWIPYWQASAGTADALAHLGTFTEINPFGYGVLADGSLTDLLSISNEPWTSFIKTAQSKKIRIAPTITWTDGSAIDRVLENPTLRNAQIKAIVALVNSHNFDGIDIDYEQKLPQTETSFALFLRDLYSAMGNKWVECDIEPEYDVDYTAYSKYCDRVKIMTYDQRVINNTLSTLTTSPYAPIADTKWVEQSITAAAKIIPKSKLVVGIATYGYEYQVSQLSSGYAYKLIGAFNPSYATNLATQLHITPVRNTAGELSFAYLPAVTSMHLLWWSDATAIASKVALAKSLGIRGVAIFKVDGGEDPKMWNVLKQ